MAVLSESSDTVQSAPLHYKEANPRLQGYSDYMLWIDKTVPATLIAYIKEHWIYRMGICQTPNGNYPFYSGELDIPLLLIGYSELTYGENGILNHDLAHKYDAYINDFKAIKQMLEIIK